MDKLTFYVLLNHETKWSVFTWTYFGLEKFILIVCFFYEITFICLKNPPYSIIFIGAWIFPLCACVG